MKFIRVTFTDVDEPTTILIPVSKIDYITVNQVVEDGRATKLWKIVVSTTNPHVRKSNSDHEELNVYSTHPTEAKAWAALDALLIALNEPETPHNP